MNTAIAKKIVDLKNRDLNLRNELIRKGELNNGYNEKMEAIHNKNAKELNQIIDKIGYPTIDRVGKDANEAAWLIIQHSISQPKFMKKCAKLLSKVVEQKQENLINLAYLIDRIAVFEGKPQLYGTQFDWDENGEMSSNHFDDISKVNKRRLSIGLNKLEEQTQTIRKRIKNENQFPPKDFGERKEGYDKWRKSVGWI